MKKVLGRTLSKRKKLGEPKERIRDCESEMPKRSELRRRRNEKGLGEFRLSNRKMPREPKQVRKNPSFLLSPAPTS